MCNNIHKHAQKQKRDRGGGGVVICGVIRLDFAGFVKKKKQTLHSFLYPTKNTGLELKILKIKLSALLLIRLSERTDENGCYVKSRGLHDSSLS